MQNICTAKEFREHRARLARIRYAKNPEKIKCYLKEWRTKNPEKQKQYKRAWASRNRAKINAYMRLWKQRQKENPRAV